MDKNSLKIISTTYEVEAGNFVYRIIGAEKDFVIRRVPIDNKLWSHGVIAQTHCVLGFAHVCNATSISHFSLDDAVKTIIFAALGDKK